MSRLAIVQALYRSVRKALPALSRIDAAEIALADYDRRCSAIWAEMDRLGYEMLEASRNYDNQPGNQIAYLRLQSAKKAFADLLDAQEATQP